MRKYPENKSYLYVTKCLFPTSLIPHLINLDFKEQFKYCWICSVIKTWQNKTNNKFGANIHSGKFQEKINNYEDYIHQLQVWDIIEIQTKNGKETYSNFEGHNYTKTYKFTISSIKSGFSYCNFKTRKPVYYTMQQNILKNNINVENNIINYTLNNINKLENIKIGNGDGNRIGGLNGEVFICDYECTKHNIKTKEEEKILTKLALGEEWVKKLECNNYRVSFGQNSGRLYHPIILMPKISRSNIYYKHSRKVNTRDIKSCYPVLMTQFIHMEEKEKYKQILKGDIYDTIREPYSKVTRDLCKIKFQQFANGYVNGFVKKWFKVNFPKSMEQMEKNYKTMSIELQQTESRIMVQGVIPFCIYNNIQDIVLLHDGWMSSGDDSGDDAIEEYVKSKIEEICGYRPEIKKETKTKQEGI